MKSTVSNFLALTLTASAVAFSSLATVASEEVLQKKCLGCHVPSTSSEGDFQLSRISHQRKTPEGWSMTIARMQHVHGLNISADDRSSLVKYLSDTQGITPKEAAPYRYILERRLNHQESKQPILAEMCARCHSEARVGLQRREQAEWDKLVHFHLGQWPSVEYSAMGRDRNWFEIAIDQVVPYLGENYGLDQEHWKQWAAQPEQSAAGRWRFVGSAPDKGDFDGVMSVKRDSKDRLKLEFRGQFANGENLEGSGTAVIYSGFEWRGSLTLNGIDYRQVFSLENEGRQLHGRMFEAEHEEMGINLSAERGKTSRVMAVSPSYLKAGEKRVLSIRGNNLAGSVELPKGLVIEKTISKNADEIKVLVRADASMSSARYSLNVGEASLVDALGVYSKVDKLEVFPSYAVARVGGEGSQNKVNASFSAKAFSAGADEKLGTDDDFYIGLLDASWKVEPFDQQAIDDNDIDFAGTMNASTGVFTPGEAGPNPKRKYGTNNAGRLSVVASLNGQDQPIEAKAELIVTVQRWNNPPIR